MDKSIQPGTVLAGKYTVEEVIGSGGMGIVVKARQMGLDRLVAIKVLLSVHRDRQHFIDRFHREAKAAARISGEHVAQVFDVGKTDEDDPYMAMEYLEGEDLGKKLKRERELSLAVAVDLMLQACAGVAAAHAARVVHRDLKPANLFLATTTKGRTVLKVIDFGISRVEEGPSNLTGTRTSLGTAYYMAPEQIERPKDVDTRVDIWALGVIFFELLTGGMPFSGSGVHGIIAAVLRNKRRHACDFIPTLPPEVDTVIDKCLAPRPEDRFATVTELAAALKVLPGIASSSPSSFSQSAFPASPSSRSLVSVPAPSSGSLPRLSGAVSPPTPQPSVPAQTTTQPLDSARQTASIEVDSSELVGLPAPAESRPRPSLQITPPPTSRQTADPMLRSLATNDHSPLPKRLAWGALVAGAGLVLLVVLMSFVVVVPRAVSSSLRDAASKGGVTVTHDAPRLTSQGVELPGFSAQVTSLPGLKLTARHARVSFGGGDLVLRDVEATSTLSVDELSRAVATTETSFPKNIQIESLHLTASVGPDLTVESTGATLVQKLSATGDRVTTIDMPEATVNSPIGALGPFDVNIERGSGRTSLHARAQGSTADGANVTVTWAGGQTHLIAHAPRATYRVPVQSLGLSADDTLDLETRVDVTIDVNGKASGNGSLSLFRTAIGGHPMDVSSDFNIVGTEGSLNADSTSARIGPFNGSVHARWIATDAKTLTLAWATEDVPCIEVARSKAHQGNSLAVLADLAQYTGVAKTVGSAFAQGNATVTMSAPPKLSSAVTKRDTCGLAIFPGP